MPSHRHLGVASADAAKAGSVMIETFDLTAARVNRGLSRRELAREVGLGRETIRRLEQGERVYPASAKKVADFFGIQATDLLPEPESRAAA